MFSLVAQSIESACDVGDLGWEDPQKRKCQPTPVFLPGESRGQRSLVGCSQWGHRELDTTERLTVSLSPSVNRNTLVIFKILYKILTMYTRKELQGTP